MNLPNFLTLSRILLAGLFVILLYTRGLPSILAALLVFVLACWTDYMDGDLARRRNQVTRFGKLLDPIADKILVFSALLAFVEMGRVPGWMVLIMLVRETAVTAFRLRAAGRSITLPAERLGKYKTAFQYAAIILVLVWIAIEETPLWNEAWRPGAAQSILGVMFFILVFTIWSGISTVIKNWTEIRMDHSHSKAAGQGSPE